jgi:SeqA protein C-terminal domain
MTEQFNFEVSLEQACAIVKFCERAGRAPLDVLLTACGAPEREPYIFDLSDFVDVRDYASWEHLEKRKPVFRTARGAQNRVYLGLLSQLIKWDEPRVSEALSKKRGRHRIYFSKDPQEIRKSGNNIDVHAIPGSDWFACTHLSGYQKHDILYKLLCSLGFSQSYSWLISWLPEDERPRIYGFSIGSSGRRAVK